MVKTKRQIARYALYGVGVLIASAVVLYVLVLRPLQIHQQKQSFAKAEASLDDLERQIEAKIGKPDAIKKDKSCGYASRVYEKGPLACSIAVYLLYTNKDYSQSSSLVSSISKLGGTGSLERFGDKKINTFVPMSTYKGDQILNQHLTSTEEISCDAQYTYPVFSKLSQPLKSNFAENFEVEFDCGGPAMAEYFPVTK